jgi:nicotinate-nucleotide pyrophosphorylase (carboxylating)
VEGSGVRILDTRKTTPGLRVLEKMAAAAGGVVNHRMGLYDAILIKNNHIRLAGGVRTAIDRARVTGKPIEVEVRVRAEIEEALDCGAARLLLDNMTPEQAAMEIAFINRRAETEISGGVTLESVRAYAQARPDFISSGAITHSARAVDINCGIYAI